MLGIDHPLRLPDAGQWNDVGHVRELVSEALGVRAKSFHNIRTMDQLRDFLESRGYDGIVYANEHEISGLNDAREAQREAQRVYQDARHRLGDAREELHYSNDEARRAPQDARAREALDVARHDLKTASESYDRALEALQASNEEIARMRKSGAADSYIAFRPNQVRDAFGAPAAPGSPNAPATSDGVTQGTVISPASDNTPIGRTSSATSVTIAMYVI